MEHSGTQHSGQIERKSASERSSSSHKKNPRTSTFIQRSRRTGPHAAIRRPTPTNEVEATSTAGTWRDAMQQATTHGTQIGPAQPRSARSGPHGRPPATPRRLAPVGLAAAPPDPRVRRRTHHHRAAREESPQRGKGSVSLRLLALRRLAAGRRHHCLRRRWQRPGRLPRMRSSRRSWGPSEPPPRELPGRSYGRTGGREVIVIITWASSASARNLFCFVVRNRSFMFALPASSYQSKLQVFVCTCRTESLEVL